MRNLIIGLLLGIGLTLSASALADDFYFEPTKSGRLKGYEVESDQGKTLCEEPYLHHELRVVKCE